VAGPARGLLLPREPPSASSGPRLPARADRLQTSLNLALGSALASIGLTVPAVAAVSLATGWTLVLGLDLKAMVLLALTLLVATLSLGTGRTTVLQGAVHLVIFAVYLFTTVVP
jgi:Ca2+:H+ antiporter